MISLLSKCLVMLVLCTASFSAEIWQSSLQELEQKANSGDKAAQIFLSDRFNQAYLGSSINYNKAHFWNEKALENDNSGISLSIEASMLEYGLGCKKDTLSAIKLFSQALPLLLKSSETGLAPAQFYLGLIYQHGWGTKIDGQKAFELYKKSAAQNYGPAQFNVGICFLSGIGVPKDSIEAFKWFSSSAEQKLARAQNMVGACYDHGIGIQEDLSIAFNWYLKAAKSGLDQAQYNLGLCYLDGRGITKDLAEAENWFAKAAEQGHAQSQVILGLAYHDGWGVSKDVSQSFIWYSKAADQGFADGQFFVGKCYLKGEGVARSQLAARKWFELAIKNDHPRQIQQDAQEYFDYCSSYSDSLLDSYSGYYSLTNEPNLKGTIICKQLSLTHFAFCLMMNTTNGNRIDFIEDTLTFINSTQAVFNKQNENSSPCTLTVSFSSKHLTISGIGCSYYGWIDLQGQFNKSETINLFGANGFSKYSSAATKLNKAFRDLSNAYLAKIKESAKLLEVKSQPTSIKLKGFFIGMSKTDLLNLVNSKYSGIFGQLIVNPASDSMHIKDAVYVITGSSNDVLFAFDNSQLLIYLFWPESYVNGLFNVEDLSPEQFVQEIVNSYNIPKMDHHSENLAAVVAGLTLNYWEYTSKDGVRLRINDTCLGSVMGMVMTVNGKGLHLERVPTHLERGFD
jgi:hypothetical protein